MRKSSPPRPLSLRERGGIGELLDWAAQRLSDVGIANPRREAAHLYGAVAGLSPAAVWLARPGPADAILIGRFDDVVAQRVAGVPFAYATGQATFRTHTLQIDRGALIPRPETEDLIDLVLARIQPGGVAADIGTGSGCIALALALEGRFERVIAVDRSPAALALARANVARLRPPVPVDVLEGDLLEPLRGTRCRVVVSNPPYLTAAEYGALDPSVRDYEPREALVSGADGLDATRRLLAGAREVLETGGLLALEIDERRADAVAALGTALGFAVVIREDVFGKPRYALAVLKEES